ncbi:1-hydroxycarotenoid 3,4-desaturase CrtD [Jannaschia seohaensis]|uniref:1-hydroxycarotenoid 3,4-desaturase n=1 Tax=Jannaschia seohaensis TaxID=475081 RepID=A0A2Y9A2B7_9RHOB|nr:1-hydroxycarotenoid 3,4-desaturase CrtD [Jannaschia seohaensis]PWJ21728.1 1-hydroxycarotenoid 3,4-desaturase [Jannaschia seohaensis]SSA38006.1 1-hydroxycarotenoid 3,4-desaturase [Jannaschia seohaensis]
MRDRVIVIGAGIGGLSAAMRLAARGCDVLVLERAAEVGGKMRTLPSAAGPVDAGPTVLTLRDVFEELFVACGTTLTEHVTLEPLVVLARHHWADGSALDLYADPEQSEAAIRAFAGGAAAAAFYDFHRDTARLFDAFDAPMMRASAPTLWGMTGVVARDPSLIPAMAPGRTLAGALARRFDDPRLRQLFGRYATYVGGDPTASPALLSLIWQAESRGVWSVAGGMHRLAAAMRTVLEGLGAHVICDTHVDRIEQTGGHVSAIHAGGTRHPCDVAVFNGDPAALHRGLLGPVRLPARAVSPRSLSAFVWSFAARVTGRPPTHHNVFFADTPNSEFPEIGLGLLPSDPTLYVCAQDRGDGPAPEGAERFEIIVNGPPRAATAPNPEEMEQCRETTFLRLARMGLTFDITPETDRLTTPEGFATLFPASDGSLYGRSPHGTLAAFARPTARTALPGLYLAGGGTHPGAGLPMAALSGKLAAEAICTDLASTSPSRRTAMPGGMSTGSAPAAPAPSRSSPSSAPSSRPGIVGADGATPTTTSASTSSPTAGAVAGR